MTATAETGRQSAAGKESAEMSTAATSAGPEADDAAALGAPIRELRKGAGLTLESVADAAQISPACSRGSSGAALPTLRTFARALGVPIAALFEGEDRSTAGEHDGRSPPRGAARRPPPLKVPDSRIQYELMVPDLEGAVEVIWGAIPPGGGAMRPARHCRGVPVDRDTAVEVGHVSQTLSVE
jgi:transcriptional regulator with XRE-family HTH domain